MYVRLWMHMYTLNVAEIKKKNMNREWRLFMFNLSNSTSLGRRWINIPGSAKRALARYGRPAPSTTSTSCAAVHRPFLPSTAGFQRFVFSSTSIASLLTMIHCRCRKRVSRSESTRCRSRSLRAHNNTGRCWCAVGADGRTDESGGIAVRTVL